MKVNLECGNDIRNGYLNISSMPVNLPPELPEDTKFVIGRYNNLDPVIEGQVDEIIFNPFINILSPSELIPVFEHWCKKLKPSGVLKISFIDIRRLARNINNGEIDIKGMHSALYGSNTSHKCLIYSSMIKPLAIEFNLSLDSLVIKDIFVTAEMRKNA